MSTKTFSAQEWENVPSKQEPAYSTVQPLNETPTDLHVEVERVVADIEVRGIDIAPQYDTWVNIGFALSEGLGEGGRDFFHRLSRLHSDYDYSTTDKQFSNCLNGKGTGVTIASFFHHAALSGVRLSHSPVTILPNYQNGKTAKWVKPANELPRFPETVFDGLPLFLLKVVSVR